MRFEIILNQIPLSKQIFSCSGFIKGEEISYVLVSESEDEFIIAAATPDPIEVRWDDGGHVSIIVLVPTMDLFLQKGKGFIQGEKISVMSYSNNERIYTEFNIPENGEFISFLLPATESSDSGHSTIVFKRENTGEERTLKYSYGKQVIYDALKNPNIQWN